MPVTSNFFGSALTQLRTLPHIPQCIGVNYLKFTLEKTRLTNHVTFLRHCIGRHILPNGFRLKFTVPSNSKPLASQLNRIITNAGFRLMSETVHSYTTRLAQLTSHIQQMRFQLRNLTDFPTSGFIINTVQLANRGLYELMSQTKKRKLDCLQPDSRKTHNDCSSLQHDHQLVVTIPSDLHLPDDQRQVLSRGLKFVPIKPTTNHATTLFQCQRFFRRLRLAAHFSEASPQSPSPTNNGDLAQLFHKQPSTWTTKTNLCHHNVKEM
jgi:hypothetical protein